ncbi:unnamed protein product, partial [Callosobruchus maculatus]
MNTSSQDYIGLWYINVEQMHFPVFCNKLAIWVPHCAGIVKFIII